MLPARRKRAAAEIRTSLDAMRAQRDLAEAFASHYTAATTILISWREWLQEIEQTNNLALKHQVIELLAGGISGGYYQHLSGTYDIPRQPGSAQEVDFYADSTPSAWTTVLQSARRWGRVARWRAAVAASWPEGWAALHGPRLVRGCQARFPGAGNGTKLRR